MHIEFEDLVKMIESLVLVRPRYVTELMELLQGAFNQPIELSLLINALEGLEEKYSEDFFGFHFHFQHDVAFFTPRHPLQIVGNRYDHYNDPIEL
ncbi:MAG: hypothetical protein E6Q24_04955 [Chitinophagaceae bacterium]|nr:MAG: hypothetical protein E6Q24_04955 [Chitinophagaceae bacterium]